MSKPTLSSFSNLLVEAWSPQFIKTSTIKSRVKISSALEDFSKFKKSYEVIVKNYYEKHFPGSGQTRRKNLWIMEQINLALDMFWEPLARVAEHHQSVPYKNLFSNTSELNDILDNFKANIMHLFGESSAGFVHDILIYFDKTTKINRFPYTKIALIGVPYRVLSEVEKNPGSRKTWMPIAHELSHHMYWNMANYLDLVVQKEKFEQGILDIQKKDYGLTADVEKLIKPWIEEIFADVVGLQISGSNDEERKEFLASSKELILRQTDNEMKNLSKDDEDHVPDGLRLLVSLKSLGVADPVKQWKDFMENEVGKPANEIELNLRDEMGHPQGKTIRATAVADQLCDTVAIILSEVDKFRVGKASLFKLQITRPTDIAQELLETAQKIGNDDPKATLEFVLNPEILEGGQGGTTHTHSVTYETANNHNHPNVTTRTHTH